MCVCVRVCTDGVHVCIEVDGMYISIYIYDFIYMYVRMILICIKCIVCVRIYIQYD